MAVELKFSKLDNTHWGFRLTGGSDCQMPLTVVKVSIFFNKIHQLKYYRYVSEIHIDL